MWAMSGGCGENARLRVVRDGAQGEGADADAHERRVVAARGRQRALTLQIIGLCTGCFCLQ